MSAPEVVSFQLNGELVEVANLPKFVNVEISKQAIRLN